MSLPSGWRINEYMGAVIAVPNIYAGIARQSWFEFQHARAVSQGGRQSAWFVEGDFGQAVLRYYRRGGLRAKFGEESYFWLGQKNVRAFAEIRVLEHLREQNILVPEPIGAAYWRSGIWYKNAILTRRIEKARTLAECLAENNQITVYKAIKAMHAAGVWHADLNANNILLDDKQQVWLIDFDRSRIMTVSDQRAHNNFLRLRRSLLKIAGPEGQAWWDKFATNF